MDKKKDTLTIGERFRLIRKTLKLNQGTIAPKLGISLGHISELENNKYKPGFDILLNLVTRYRVNLNYLLFNKGEMFLKSKSHSIIRKFFDGMKLSKFETKFLEYFQNSLICRYKLIGKFQQIMLREKDAIESDTRQKTTNNTKKNDNSVKTESVDTGKAGEENFATRLTRIRKEFGLNKTKFSEKVGSSQSAISEMENARHKPGWDFIIKLLLNCDVNPYYLFLGQKPVFMNGEESGDFYYTEDVDLSQYEVEFLNFFRDSYFVRVRLLGHFQQILVEEGELIHKEMKELIG